jgi:hypothetical protein
LSQANPREHHLFDSGNNALKLRSPIVIDEHEMTGLTVSTIQSQFDADNVTTIEISTSGPLVLKETGSAEEKFNLKKTLSVPGNDSIHIQSPRNYDYPPGKEGECCAQANLLLRKYEKFDDRELPCDSLSIDILVRRKFLNVFKAVWTSADGIAVNLGSSAFITALVALLTPLLGPNTGQITPQVAVVFVFLALAISVLYSWYTVERIISKRLAMNSRWLELQGDSN